MGAHVRAGVEGWVGQDGASACEVAGQLPARSNLVGVRWRFAVSLPPKSTAPAARLGRSVIEAHLLALWGAHPARQHARPACRGSLADLIPGSHCVRADRDNTCTS